MTMVRGFFIVAEKHFGRCVVQSDGMRFQEKSLEEL